MTFFPFYFTLFPMGKQKQERTHIYLHKSYLQKIADNKASGETNTRFVERAIDYMVESEKRNPEVFSRFSKVLAKLSESSSSET